MNALNSNPKIQEASTGEYHVASFVAHVVPDMTDEMIADINGIKGAEIHAVSDQGKVVFTIEAASQSQIGKYIDQLKHHIGLLSLSPIYHQFLIE
ncbi:chaperone NapD [Thalassotalea fusca]